MKTRSEFSELMRACYVLESGGLALIPSETRQTLINQFIADSTKSDKRPIQLKSIQEMPLCEQAAFCEGCYTYALSKIEKLSKVLLKIHKLPIIRLLADPEKRSLIELGNILEDINLVLTKPSELTEEIADRISRFTDSIPKEIFRLRLTVTAIAIILINIVLIAVSNLVL